MCDLISGYRFPDGTLHFHTDADVEAAWERAGDGGRIFWADCVGHQGWKFCFGEPPPGSTEVEGMEYLIDQDLRRYSKLMHGAGYQELVQRDAASVARGLKACKRGRRLCERGNRLCKRGRRLCGRGNRLCERGNRLCERGNRLCERGGWLCERGGWLCTRGGWLCERGGWLCTRGNRLCEQGLRLCEQGNGLCEQGNGLCFNITFMLGHHR